MLRALLCLAALLLCLACPAHARCKPRAPGQDAIVSIAAVCWQGGVVVTSVYSQTSVDLVVTATLKGGATRVLDPSEFEVATGFELVYLGGGVVYAQWPTWDAGTVSRIVVTAQGKHGPVECFTGLAVGPWVN